MGRTETSKRGLKRELMLEGAAFRNGWAVPPAAARRAIKRADGLIKRKKLKRPIVVGGELEQVEDQAMCDHLAMKAAEVLLAATKIKQTDDHKITELRRIDAGKANQAVDIKGVAFERVIQPEGDPQDAV